MFHYYQTITFSWYQALGSHSKNRFQYHVITMILIITMETKDQKVFR